MATADHATRDSRDAGAYATVLVPAEEGWAVPARTWARMESHPRGCGQRRSTCPLGRTNAPGCWVRRPGSEEVTSAPGVRAGVSGTPARLHSAEPSPPPTCDRNPPRPGRCVHLPTPSPPPRAAARAPRGSPRALPGAGSPALGIPARLHVHRPLRGKARSRSPSLAPELRRGEDWKSRRPAPARASRRRVEGLAGTSAPPRPGGGRRDPVPPRSSPRAARGWGGLQSSSRGRGRDGNVGNPRTLRFSKVLETRECHRSLGRPQQAWESSPPPEVTEVPPQIR
ncbi:protein FAM246C-like [Desmodus rotundus]|uniref:protein FAM246C-like n=1 Tax=Desmodus rotundus TaxID=9430 RepID=UPI0039E3B24A